MTLCSEGSQEWAEPSASPPERRRSSAPWGWGPRGWALGLGQYLHSSQRAGGDPQGPGPLPFLGSEAGLLWGPQLGHSAPTSSPVRGLLVVWTPRSVPRHSCWWGREEPASPSPPAGSVRVHLLRATQASSEDPGRSVCVCVVSSPCASPSSERKKLTSRQAPLDDRPAPGVVPLWYFHT